MNLNYCPVPGASQPRGMRFDAENSRCIPVERMTPDDAGGADCGGEDADDEPEIYRPIPMEHTHGGED